MMVDTSLALEKAERAIADLEAELEQLLNAADVNPCADVLKIIWCRHRLRQERENLDAAGRQRDQRYG